MKTLNCNLHTTCRIPLSSKRVKYYQDLPFRLFHKKRLADKGTFILYDIDKLQITVLLCIKKVL